LRDTRHVSWGAHTVETKQKQTTTKQTSKSWLENKNKKQRVIYKEDTYVVDSGREAEGPNTAPGTTVKTGLGAVSGSGATVGGGGAISWYFPDEHAASSVSNLTKSFSLKYRISSKSSAFDGQLSRVAQ
jgi:hypothetical protein